MKVSWRAELVQLAIIAAMFAVAAWAWSRLPDKIPVHWNVHGEVDRFGGKFEGLLVFPLTSLGIYALTLILPVFDPGRLNYRNFAKAYNAIRIVFVVFMGLLYTVTLMVAFGNSISVNTVVMLLMAVLFIVLGNFMSKIRPNWFVGVRTPWTLSSKLSWDKTHRLAGWVFMLIGTMFALVAAFPSAWVLITTLIVDGLLVIWIIIYSYLVFRRDPDRTPPAGTSPGVE
jgi:uncharacterized membrane protein